MVSALEKTGRYERGVKNLDPVKAAAIQAVLAVSPTITRAELGRRVGLSKSSVAYYLRGLQADVAAATAKREEIREQRGETQAELAEMVATLATRMNDEARKLLDRSMDDLPAKTVAGKLASACAQLARASAALSGKPTTTNVHIQQLQALLMAPVDLNRLSPVARAVHGMADDAANS
jgi:hypothetical protein